MSDQESFREQRRQWKEDRRKMREEWKARWRERYPHMHGRHIGNGGIWTGVFILLIGVAALIKATVTDLPTWVFSWQSFLILLGLFIGVKHGFRGGAWFILILIGGAFLIPEIYPEITIRRYIWPVALILVGFFIILRRSGRGWNGYSDDEKKNPGPGPGVGDATTVNEAFDSKEDFIHATSVFGGTKKNIISKNFRGGDLVSVFGGTEIDLSRADLNGTASLDLTTIFGGTKLIVPANWEVKSEAAVIFGGIEDKRPVVASPEGTPKRLLLKGTIMFGGVDIKSY